MSRGAVQFVVDFAIHAGKLEAFETAVQAALAGSRKEAGTVGYDFYLSADRMRCRLVENYVDGSAALAHMTGPVAAEVVPKMLEAARVDAFEIYGDPGAKTAEIVAAFRAEIFPLWHALKA